MGKLREAMNQMMDDGDFGGYLERGVRSCGISMFDYMNGRFDKDGNLELGLGEGKIAYFAGYSGSGKSTMAIQTAWEMIKDDEDAQLFIEDCERSNSHLRVAQLAGIPFDEYQATIQEDKVKLINSGTSTNQLLALIRQIYETKMSVIGGVNFTKKGTDDKTKWSKVREKIQTMPLTVIIVDSWALLAPSKVDDSGELRGNMDAPQVAKANNALIKQVCGTGWLYDANIVLIIVNHITKSISAELYPPDARPVKWMKKDESLPGGATAAYMADFMLRMDQSKALKEDEEMKVKGFICNVILCKSRSNASGHSISLVFDQYRGADNILTNYLMLKSANMIAGSGNGYWLKGLDSVKFLQSNIREVYAKSAPFRERFDELVHGELSEFIKSIAGKEGKDVQKVIDTIPEYKLTRTDVMISTIKELKEIAKANSLDVDPEFWKGDIEDIRQGMADALFEPEETEE
jgi:RecA/RadA recombinase